MSPAGTTVLKLSGVSKSFPPATRALIAADLEMRAGEVHALLGENGAGKSTLSRIVAGLLAPDAGQMSLQGEPYIPRGRREAQGRGVRMVMQELNLIPTLTIAESIFLDRLPRRLGFIRRTELNARALPLLREVGLGSVDPETPIGALGVGLRQMVEIAAGLSERCDVLILDEPTAALTDEETALLFHSINRLRAAGVAIIYISHRMNEIARIADRVTILRDGAIVATRAAAGLALDEIIRLMVGRELSRAAVRAAQASRTDIALRVAGLRAEPAVRDVSFELHRGEILGFAGLMGSGRTETMRAIFGADAKQAGEIYLGGSSAPESIRSPRDAVRRGIALLTEDRKGQGLLLPWSVRHNITLAAMASVRGTAGWIDAARENADAHRLVETLGIRCSGIDQPVRELSGGNQQKVIIARWLYRDCEILIFDEPTRGIDIGAKFEIYRLLADLAARGKAIIVISSELPELLAICDRIAVLSAGVLVRTFAAREFDPDAIMAAALTHHVKPHGADPAGTGDTNTGATANTPDAGRAA